MPTEYWYPISTATHDLPPSADAAGNFGGANKNVSCRDTADRSSVTPDDATTYIYGGSNGFPTNYQALNIDWPYPMGAYTDATFNMSWRYRYHLYGGAGSTAYWYLYWCNSTPTAGNLIAQGSGGPGTSAFATSGPTSSVNSANKRPGGGNWSPTDFANDKTTFFYLGFYDSGGGGNNTYTDGSTIYGQIDYNPPSGGFAFLLGLVGLMALQYVGTMTDYQQFNRYLEWRQYNHPRGTIWNGEEEKLKAWIDVKAYKYPTFYFQGYARG